MQYQSQNLFVNESQVLLTCSNPRQYSCYVHAIVVSNCYYFDLVSEFWIWTCLEYFLTILIHTSSVCEGHIVNLFVVFVQLAAYLLLTL